MRNRYKNSEANMFICNKSELSKGDSIWWSNITLVDFNSETNNSFFSKLINCRLCDGKKFLCGIVNGLVIKL